MSDPHVFEHERITVTWSKARCTHAAECVRGLPQVFQPGRRPWVEPGRDSAERVAEVVRRCPTGALHYQRHDGGPAEESPGGNAVVPAPFGPLTLRGRIELVADDGREIARDTRMTLCRCGVSRNKPFCDGSHGENAFDDEGRLGGGGAPAAVEEPGGTLRITVTPGQPLRVEGPFRLASARGEASRALDRALLCCCGGSRNKPFCDGSHRRVRHEGDSE
jgi:CDGSH-type Zn-finger protein/uncharacterized Fe-S cluster protein YjdI